MFCYRHACRYQGSSEAGGDCKLKNADEGHKKAVSKLPDFRVGGVPQPDPPLCPETYLFLKCGHPHQVFQNSPR